jgi:hypothetical protein
MGETIMRTKLWSESLKTRDQSEDLGVDEITLEWILRKQGEKTWTGLIWLRIEISSGLS